MEKVVDEAGEVEVNDGPPGLSLGFERARAEVELEVLDHGRLSGLSLACGRGERICMRQRVLTHTAVLNGNTYPARGSSSGAYAFGAPASLVPVLGRCHRCRIADFTFECWVLLATRDRRT